MSRTGPSIPLTEFKKLLKEDAFIDYFNKFICLPAFSQLAVYSCERNKFILHPPLPANRYVLNYNGLVEWLWRKRFDLFLRSKFYGEYRFCHMLVSYSLLHGNRRQMTKPDERAVYDALHWFQKKCLGRVAAIRKFRKFLHQNKEGYKLYQYWLDVDRLYSHLKRDSDTCMDVFTYIKEKYFMGNSVSRMPQNLLDSAWKMLPNSRRRDCLPSGERTYDVTFTICLQRLCGNRLKRYWLPRYLMRQEPVVADEKEAAYLTLAQKYLHGAINPFPGHSRRVNSEDELTELEDDKETDSHGEQDDRGEDDQDVAEEPAVDVAGDSLDVDETEENKEKAQLQKKQGRKGVSFSEHPPPGAPTSSDEEQPMNIEEDVSTESSEDEEEYKKRMEKRKAQARERRMRRELSDSKKTEQAEQAGKEEEESDSESARTRPDAAPLEKEETQKRSKDSSGGSDSAESWEGIHDEYRRKKKGEKKFRFKDRHRKRSIHKRQMKFEELLVKESYRRPSMGADKVKLFAKGKMNIDQQKILVDDEDDDDGFRGSSPDSNRGSPSKTSAGAGVGDIGGKALLKAALKIPSGNMAGFGAAQSRISFQDAEDTEKPDLFNRSPSMWDLSLGEISQRMGKRGSDLSSGGSRNIGSRSSQNSLLKVGRQRRASSLLDRTPSQDSAGSSAVTTGSKTKRKSVAKPKVKRTKVTTLTFSLSGDAPAPTEKARVESTKADKRKSTYCKELKVPARARKSRPQAKIMSIANDTPIMQSRIFSMEKDNNYRIRADNRRMIVALQAEDCASQPFRCFLQATDNEEMVSYLSFWQDVEKTRQDFEFGIMKFTSFMQSIQSIVTQYLLQSSPSRIEAPEILREEAIMNCVSPEMQEMPWQMRKLQMEVMEDLKYAHEAFCQQDLQSFLNAAALRKDDMHQGLKNANRRNTLPPMFKMPHDAAMEIGQDLSTEMNCRMKRSLQLVIELNLPEGRELSSDVDESGDESDDDGRMRSPKPPKYVTVPPIDYKELASRSLKQYPDPSNPLGSKSSIKMAYDRRLQSASFYKPLKRGGQFLKRPMTRPKGFNEVLKDTVHFEFFKRFLKAYRSDAPLSFWHAVEILRSTDKVKLRQSRARAILKKYFHNTKIPATKMLQCSSDIIKEIPFLDIVTTSTLFTAQTVVVRVLEERWFKRYAETFVESVDSSHADLTDKSLNARSLISRNRRLKRIWMIFSEFIKRAASFLRAMRKPRMFTLFKNFLQKEIENYDSAQVESDHMSEFFANRSGSTAPPFMFSRADDEDDRPKQRLLNGSLVTYNFLPNDLYFWMDIECYKTIADCSSATESLGADYEGEMYRLKRKADLIVRCYLESDIPPTIRVNVPSEVADITIESLQNDLIDRGLFHEATVYVFPLLLMFWKRFCAEHYRYVPTLSKKHRRIYGLKMTPVIEQQLRNLKKGKVPTPEPVKEIKKKKKSKRIPTEDLPDYMDIDMTKVSKRRGSPFAGGEEIGPRLTFSVRKGLTWIEPVRRRKYQIMKGGSPDVRVVHEPSPPPESPIRPMLPVDELRQSRHDRRSSVLDESLLQKFAMFSSE